MGDPSRSASWSGTLMIGKTLSHYRVDDQLGAGAMGVVYRARDERLDRDVAIKVLSEGLIADDAARRRLRREARSLSKLNHANVEIIFDFDAHEGVDFLVMEYVEGEDLGAKLGSASMSEKEVLAIGAQIAAALEAAHEHGIVHRDLKPGNVMVTPRGQVKVLDFGLAKLLRPEAEAVSSESLSDSHAAAGTLPYMAPEQLRGEVDLRSDLFAAGAVLYEMATSTRPFPDESGPELIYAILHRDPRPPSLLNHRVSPALEGVILKALEKDPACRYQSATELRVDLERLSLPVTSTAPGAPHSKGRKPSYRIAAAIAGLAILLFALDAGGIRSRISGGGPGGRIEALAVLPLENISGDATQLPFVEGMHEALTTELGKIRTLQVKGRQTMRRYRDSDLTPREIASEIGVGALIEGSVRQAEGRVVISLHLLCADTEELLWSQSFERELDEILLLQGEIASAVARSIQIELSPEEQASLKHARRVDPRAYDKYVHGIFEWNKRTPDGFRRSVELFEEAVEVDPRFARAYAKLSDTFGLSCFWDLSLSPLEVLPKARVAAERALAIEPELTEGRTALALLKMTYERDLEAALEILDRVLEQNPSYAYARHARANVLGMIGRTNEAIAEAHKAVALDPKALMYDTFIAHLLLNDRRVDEAIQHSRSILATYDAFPPAHLMLGFGYHAKGRYEEAMAEFRRADGPLGELSLDQVIAWEAVQAAEGWREAARWRLLDLEERAERSFVSPMVIARHHAILGHVEQTLDWLERGYEVKDPMFLVAFRLPVFDHLHDEPRFQALIEKLGVRW